MRINEIAVVMISLCVCSKRLTFTVLKLQKIEVKKLQKIGVLRLQKIEVLILQKIEVMKHF